MVLKKFAEVECPLCGTRQLIHFKEDGCRFNIVLCDCENTSGCGEYFIVEVRAEPKATAFVIADKDGNKLIDATAVPFEPAPEDAAVVERREQDEERREAWQIKES